MNHREELEKENEAYKRDRELIEQRRNEDLARVNERYDDKLYYREQKHLKKVEQIKQREKAESEGLTEKLKAEEQRKINEKIYAKTEAGRMEQAQIHAYQNIQRDKAMGLSQADIELKYKDPHTRVEIIEERSKQETENTMDDWQRKSRTEYSDLDEFF